MPTERVGTGTSRSQSGTVIAAVLVLDPSGSKGSALLRLRPVAGAEAVVFAAAPLIAAAGVPRSIGTTLKETG